MRAVLLAASLIVGGAAIAASNPPVPSGRESVQKPNPSTDKPASQPAYEQRGTEAAPLFVKSIPSAEDKDEAAHKEYERHEKPALDRRLTISTELLALFTFLLFVFTACLWWVTYRLSRDAKEASSRQAVQTESALAISKTAADAALASATAAKNHFDVAAEDLRRTHRAWVAFAKDEIPCTLEFSDNKLKSAGGLVRAINSGSSIANGVSVFTALSVGTVGDDPRSFAVDPQLHLAATGLGRMLIPGMECQFRLDLSAAVPKNAGRELVVYLSIQLLYQDQFGLPHCTAQLFKYVTTEGRNSFLAGGVLDGGFNAQGVGGSAN